MYQYYMEKKKVAGAGRIDPDPDPTLEKKQNI